MSKEEKVGDVTLEGPEVRPEEVAEASEDRCEADSGQRAGTPEVAWHHGSESAGGVPGGQE